MKVIVLSPHRDDAAFSCGLLLRNLLTAGANATVVNIFTVSEYAPYFFIDGLDRIMQVTDLRAAEDEAFFRSLFEDAAALTEALISINLKWQDAPLRLQVRDEEVLQPERLLQAEVYRLSRALPAATPDTLILAPLAIGDHVDHVLTRKAALQTYDESQLFFYEDLPYTCRIPEQQRSSPHELKRAELKRWSPVESSQPGTKRRFASCYPSQISPKVAQEMEDCAARLGYRERFFAPPAAIQQMEAALENCEAAV